MVGFWISVLLLVLLGAAFFVPVLIGRHPRSGMSQSQLNILLHEQRQQELREAADDSADLSLLSSESERSLLDDLDSFKNKTSGDPDAASGRTSLIAVLALIPFLGLISYLALGRPDLLNHEEQSAKAVKMEDSINKLAEHLKQKPDDLEGWILLGKSLETMNQPEKALRAFEFAEKLAPDNLDIKSMIAEALAEANGGQAAGRPAEMVAEILKKNPEHKGALWMAGIAAAENNDFNAAIEYWQRLQSQFQANSEESVKIGEYISEARQQMAAAGASATGASAAPVKPVAKADGRGRHFKVKVLLADSLIPKANPDATVFVFARAASGPPMPLAVVKRQVRDLPLEVELDDSMSMMQGMNLSSFDRIVIGSRISLSGKPTPSAGDFQGLSDPLSPVDGSSYQVTINSVVGEASPK